MELDRWLGIELRHLVALQSVAEEGTFRGAAKRLGYTQSAISQQIATLERLVGTKLIERPGGPRPVFLTEPGRLVLRHAEVISARLKAAQADITAMIEGEAGSLRVGTFQSAGARILPPLVRRFSAAWPNVALQLTESASDGELIACVERGELDLAFAMPPLPEGPFAMVELMRDPWVLLAPCDSPLALRGKPVSLREVAQMPLIGGCGCRVQLQAHFLADGLEPRYVFHSEENTTVHGLVAAGAGVALTPELAVDPNDDRVVAIEVGPKKLPPRVIALAWHRDRYRPPVADAFVDLAKALCAELERDAAPLIAAAG